MTAPPPTPDSPTPPGPADSTPAPAQADGPKPAAPADSAPARPEGPKAGAEPAPAAQPADSSTAPAQAGGPKPVADPAPVQPATAAPPAGTPAPAGRGGTQLTGSAAPAGFAPLGVPPAKPQPQAAGAPAAVPAHRQDPPPPAAKAAPPPPPKPPRWPGPSVVPTPAAMCAVLGAGAVGALSIPLGEPGLGWLIAGVAAAISLMMARSGIALGSPATLPADRHGWIVATVALLGVGTVRAADWLFTLCLLAAVVTAALAISPGRSIRALLYGVATGPVAAARALPWLGAGALAMRRRAGGPRARLAAPFGIAAALLLVFGGLFASADAAFAELLDAATPNVDAGIVARCLFLLPIIAAVLGGAAFLRAAPPRVADLDEPRYRPVRRFEWLVPLAALDLLFAGFVLLQATVLFGGGRHVLSTAGLTYAQYARAGFWQLLIVTGLTLVVLAGAVRWAPRADRRDRTIVRVLLGVLAGLTLLIVASALYRMTVYADAYGLTRLRILVFTCELWLGVVFVLVLAAGVRLRAPWLPRTVVAAGVVALLGLVAVNPDHAIAEHNLSHGRLDIWYLRNLSADAVPALDGAPAELRACLLARNAYRLAQAPDGWRQFNLARERARDILAARPTDTTSASCASVTRPPR